MDLENNTELVQQARYTIAIKHKSNAKTSQDYSNVLEELSQVGEDYKDVKILADECKQRMEEEKIKEEANEKKGVKKRAMIASIAVAVTIAASFGGCFICQSNTINDFNNYIETNEFESAYDLYCKNSPFFNENDYEKIIQACIKHDDINTLFGIADDIVGDNYLYGKTYISKSMDIIKNNLKENQYQEYYYRVIEAYSDHYDDLYKIYNYYYLFKALPADYENVSKINEAYEMLVELGADDSDRLTFCDFEGYEDSDIEEYISWI